MQAVWKGKAENERAVSEAIGFILIFGIIISGIALVTLYGYPMLLQQQTNADEQIMEKNMIVLQNDVKSLAYKTVPYKETSLKVGGGALAVYNTSFESTNGGANFQIYDDGGTIATSANPIKFWPGDLRYESTSAQTEMSLENGAVVKRMLAQDGSAMLAEPRWFVDDQTNIAVIYLIGINSTESMAQTGVGTVRMGLDQAKTNSTFYDILSGDTIHVTYEPNPNANYSTAWENYFHTVLGMNPDGSGGYTFPSGTVNKLVVNRYEIMIKSV